MEDLNNISRLIADSILNKLLSETEQRQLDAWLQTSEANRQLYSRIKELHATQQILKLEKEGYGKKMAERFRKEVTPPLRFGTAGLRFTSGWEVQQLF